ncbi:NAD(P)/FAD-dependent oxidoreductase [Bradyrhizobium prioriisuperbiae]|uniref:FAD-dependent oxidoreductase n=1 Tax=Bradyrhizobium prioriisuperbiae TaxID=2854389 RepID=UPI0028E5A35F|nr:NAD(P)/FAD-dependent oxidoreductase [Bradyrhizobium prioritasuperba]
MSRNQFQETGRVAIIGAGLGGLCLAQGLRRAGITVDVYERDAAPDSRDQGYRIRINDCGQRALAQCLPDHLYRLFCDTCARSETGGRFCDPQLVPVTGRAAGTWRPSVVDTTGAQEEELAERGDLSANRQTLREILLCGLLDRVHFGKSFRRFDLKSDGKVAIAFEDGSSVQSDIVVAADGVGSPVRAQRWPHARAADTGSVCIYGTTRLSPEIRSLIAPSLLRGTSVIFADGFALIVDAMRFRQSPVTAGWLCDGSLSPVEDYLYWAFIGPRDCFGFDESGDLPPAGPALRSIVACRTYDWHPGLRAMFEHGERSSLAMLPVRSVVLQAAWIPTPVTILGDAAHAMSPAGGLGANTALDDAARLAGRLEEAAAGDLSPLAAIAAYEHDMRLRAGAAIQLSQQGAARLFSPA